MKIDVCCSKTKTIDMKSEFFSFDSEDDFFTWFRQFSSVYKTVIVTISKS